MMKSYYIKYTFKKSLNCLSNSLSKSDFLTVNTNNSNKNLILSVSCVVYQNSKTQDKDKQVIYYL